MDPSEWHFYVMDNIRKTEAQKQHDIRQQQRKARIVDKRSKQKNKEEGAKCSALNMDLETNLSPSQIVQS
jgi:hypothetical protein